MQSIKIDGIIRDLKHLESFVVKLADKGRDNADLRVAIHLGLHTVSRACQPDEVSNMLDENKAPRVFCEDRYAFSFGLKDIATLMVQEKYFCWVSKDRNRAMNYAVLDVAPGKFHELKDGDYYVIYFYLYPAARENADVDLYITSCYRKSLRFSKEDRRYTTHVLLRECYFKQKRLP